MILTRAQLDCKDETPKMLEDCVAGVVGIPYNDCKHEGGTEVSQEVGAEFARVANLALGVLREGELVLGYNIVRPLRVTGGAKAFEGCMKFMCSDKSSGML